MASGYISRHVGINARLVAGTHTITDVKHAIVVFAMASAKKLIIDVLSQHGSSLTDSENADLNGVCMKLDTLIKGLK
jgi:hypothetical protein